MKKKILVSVLVVTLVFVGGFIGYRLAEVKLTDALMAQGRNTLQMLRERNEARVALAASESARAEAEAGYREMTQLTENAQAGWRECLTGRRY